MSVNYREEDTPRLCLWLSDVGPSGVLCSWYKAKDTLLSPYVREYRVLLKLIIWRRFIPPAALKLVTRGKIKTQKIHGPDYIIVCLIVSLRHVNQRHRLQ